MAEATFLRNNALPYPIYGAPYTIIVPLLDADGDPVSPSSADSEISKNGDTAADCTNEATEISGLTGICYLSLTGTELTADVVAGETSSTGAKTTPWALFPRKLVTIRSGTSASGGSDQDGIVLDSGASDQDDFYNGMVVIATIDSNIEVRVISDYTGSTKKASVVPDFNVAPDNNDTFVIKLPEGVQLNQANLTHISGAAVSTSTAQLGVNTVNAGGTAWGSGAITANSIAADAITAAKIANGAIDAATFAADVDAEILSYIVDDATRIDASALNTASVTTIPAILVDTGTTLDGKIDTIDTVVDAVKAKTDSLTFTVANTVNANITYVNETEVTGDGQSGTEWGPA